MPKLCLMRLSVSEPFSWPMHHDRAAAKPADAAHDGLVLGEVAVAGERREILDQGADEVEAMRPLGVARDLRLLPGRELGVGVDEGGCAFCSSFVTSSAICGPPSLCIALSSDTLLSSSAIGFSKSR